jgi:hypothetical protein
VGFGGKNKMIYIPQILEVPQFFNGGEMWKMYVFYSK